MLTQHYTAQQRRALNQIWTAAGEYGFDPLFLAMGSCGGDCSGITSSSGSEPRLSGKRTAIL